jgi:hypothetical protein
MTTSILERGAFDNTYSTPTVSVTLEEVACTYLCCRSAGFSSEGNLDRVSLAVRARRANHALCRFLNVSWVRALS